MVGPVSRHDHAGSVPQKSALVTSGIVCHRMTGVLPPAVRRLRYAPAPFLRLCACAPLSRSPNRRPKHIMIGLGEKSVLKASVKPVAF